MRAPRNEAHDMQDYERLISGQTSGSHRPLQYDSERHFDSVKPEYSNIRCSNRGSVKSYISIGSSSQIHDSSLEYLNI